MILNTTNFLHTDSIRIAQEPGGGSSALRISNVQSHVCNCARPERKTVYIPDVRQTTEPLAQDCVQPPQQSGTKG